MEEDRQAKFDYTKPMSGRFRNAFRGVWTAPPRDAGRACVVKEFKGTFVWKPSGWDETLKINERAKELAAGFNHEVHTNKPISFTDVYVLKVVSGPHARPKYVTCEDFIPGQFNKWCNNYGFISTESSSLPAFMHWSWYHTGGEEMVTDLQGVRNPNSFKLTDPAMISLSQNYGATDTGVEGMAMFFLHHKCNSFCNDLPAPTLAHFRRIIPQQYLEAAKTQLAKLYNSTTYRMELKFPRDIQGRVAARFREIASN